MKENTPKEINRPPTKQPETENTPIENEHQKKPNPPKKTFKLKKWASCITFSFLYMVLWFIPFPFQAITKSVTEIYGITISLVDFSNAMWSVGCILSGFFANYLVTKIRVKKTMLIGGLLWVVGGYLRTMINQDIWLYILGCFIVGLGAPFIANVLAVFSHDWFEPKGVSSSFD